MLTGIQISASCSVAFHVVFKPNIRTLVRRVSVNCQLLGDILLSCPSVRIGAMFLLVFDTLSNDRQDFSNASNKRRWKCWTGEH